MKLLVVGSLRDVPGQPELCASFVAKLAEQIVERGHTLLNGCRGSLDKATAEAAHARLKVLGRSAESQLLGYRLQDAEPVHRLGTIRISERTDWDLTHPQLMPPEQFDEADAAMFVAGGQGTFIAANWARIAGVPVLGVAQFGGAGGELYAYEKAQIEVKFRRSITLDEFAVLNQDTANVTKLAADVVALAERIVLPRTVFPILSFATPYEDVKDSFESSCKEAGFELRGTDGTPSAACASSSLTASAPFPAHSPPPPRPHGKNRSPRSTVVAQPPQYRQLTVSTPAGCRFLICPMIRGMNI
jgi:hypothetical protein